MLHHRNAPDLTAVLAIGGVVGVILLAVMLVSLPLPPISPAVASVQATRAVAAVATKAVPVTQAVPKATLVSEWLKRGSVDNTDVPLSANGTYLFTWTMEIIGASPRDPLATFEVELIPYPEPLPSTSHSTPGHIILADFEQREHQVGPWNGDVIVPHVTSGNYFLRVTTCDYCSWHVWLWQH